MRTRTLLPTLALALLAAACGASDETTEDASVSFASISDGDTVASPVSVAFEADGLEVAEAGEVVDGEGHFHVLIDVPCVEPGTIIPADDQHIHYGDASTSAELELEPGEHTLCLQAGDGAHTALDLTDEVTITVDG